ncbi:hypothetical protein SH528x_003023 [Novipirellula sp. SH528]
MANREHKAYPNIRETPFYSPGAAKSGEFTIDNLSSPPGYG